MFRVPFRLPVPRNTLFKGREVLLKKIHGILNPDGSKDRRVVVLHGLGGIGKSQLSIEYAYRYHSLYSSVFWIDATSQATLSRSALLMAEQLVAHYGTKWVDSDPDFTQIGVMMGLPGCVGPAGILVKREEEDVMGLIVSAMGKWLSSTGNNNWLVIFENNDEIGSVGLQDFVPIVEFGSIIITTRRAEISYLGVEVEVEQIDKDSGISILLASADRDPVSVDREGKLSCSMKRSLCVCARAQRPLVRLSSSGNDCREIGLSPPCTQPSRRIYSRYANATVKIPTALYHNLRTHSLSRV